MANHVERMAVLHTLSCRGRDSAIDRTSVTNVIGRLAGSTTPAYGQKMSQPLWKRVFDTVERGSGPVLTRTLSNPDVLEMMTLAVAVRRRAESDLAGLARRGLHLFNLPAGTDISKVSHQVAGLEREIRQLNRRIAELQSTPPKHEAKEETES